VRVLELELAGGGGGYVSERRHGPPAAAGSLRIAQRGICIVFRDARVSRFVFDGGERAR
jgi:hypothetical protein